MSPDFELLPAINYRRSPFDSGQYTVRFGESSISIPYTYLTVPCSVVLKP